MLTVLLNISKYSTKQLLAGWSLQTWTRWTIFFIVDNTTSPVKDN